MQHCKTLKAARKCFFARAKVMSQCVVVTVIVLKFMFVTSKATALITKEKISKNTCRKLLGKYSDLNFSFVTPMLPSLTNGVGSSLHPTDRQRQWCAERVFLSGRRRNVVMLKIRPWNSCLGRDDAQKKKCPYPGKNRLEYYHSTSFKYSMTTKAHLEQHGIRDSDIPRKETEQQPLFASDEYSDIIKTALNVLKMELKLKKTSVKIINKLGGILLSNSSLVRALLSPSQASSEPSVDDSSITKDSKELPLTGPITQLKAKVGPIRNKQLLEMILRHPSLMANVLMSENIRTTQSQLCSDLALTPTQIHKITTNVTAVAMSRLVRSDVRSMIHFFRHEVGLTNTQVRKMIVSRPQVLSYSVENFRHTVHFFTNELHLCHREVARMILTMPLVLAYSVEAKLRPTVDFLREEFGCGSTDWNGWKKIITRYPQVFSKPVEKTLRPKAAFLSKELKLQRRSDLSNIISRFPPTLWLTEDNLRAKVNFLKEELDLEDDNVRDIIVTFPPILGLSLENNLRPTVEFLLSPVSGGYSNRKDNDCNDDVDTDTTTRGGGLTREELKEFVLYQPSLLAYSLDSRIRPRLRRMQEYQISFSYSPRYLMSYSDEKFDEWLDMHTSSWTVNS